MDSEMDASLDFRCVVCESSLDLYIPKISDDRYGCPGIFSIARCSECGQMATLPPLQEIDLSKLYGNYYPRKSVDFMVIGTEARKVLAPGARLRRWLAGTDNQGHYYATVGQKVLDIGSGSCLALLELREMGVLGFGVEADPNVQKIADYFGLSVHIGSIHDNPFPDESFDLIVLNQVIEHVPDPLALLRVAKERLKSGGRIILSFPNTDSRQAISSGVHWINWHVPYHQHHFNRRSFARLAIRAGYKVNSIRTITPNLWTMLQAETNKLATKTGCASALWVNSANNKEKLNFFARLKRALLFRIRNVFITINNRVWDAVGRGDSILVELVSNNTEHK